MTHEEQLRRWVEGEPVHGAGSLAECCPDFSCCHPALLWPREKREEFAAADDRARQRLLFGALVDLLAAEGADDVYVAGGMEDA